MSSRTAVKKSVRVECQKNSKMQHISNPNSNLEYLKKSTKFLYAGQPKISRRKIESRILRKSCNLSDMFREKGLSISEFSKTCASHERDTRSKIILDDVPSITGASVVGSCKSNSSNLNVLQENEKQLTSESLGATLPISEEFVKVSTAEENQCYVSNLSQMMSTHSGNFDTFNELEVELKVDFSEDELEIACTEDDIILPPYYEMIPEMFYRFAGISEYSDSNILQSRGDFEALLKCLGMESLLEGFIFWFPEPVLIKTGQGYISFGQFCDLFSCKFAQTILESRWQYETLCSALLTMKCLDRKKINRVEFQQFLQLCQSLYEDDDKNLDDIKRIFRKYDTDGIGFLTIVNIFNFCCDEKDGLI